MRTLNILTTITLALTTSVTFAKGNLTFDSLESSIKDATKIIADATDCSVITTAGQDELTISLKSADSTVDVKVAKGEELYVYTKTLKDNSYSTIYTFTQNGALTILHQEGRNDIVVLFNMKERTKASCYVDRQK